MPGRARKRGDESRPAGSCSVRSARSEPTRKTYHSGQRSRLARARGARARLSFSARPVSVPCSPSSAGANDASLGIQSRGG